MSAVECSVDHKMQMVHRMQHCKRLLHSRNACHAVPGGVRKSPTAEMLKSSSSPVIGPVIGRNAALGLA